jgi:dihydroorotate dehydrogenase
MDGVIATNTTLSRPAEVSGHPRAGETGGLSGDPLMPISLRMVKEIVCRTGGKLPVVGVGGIRTPESAWRMLDAGAALVQVYTGLIYDGPGIVRRMVR